MKRLTLGVALSFLVLSQARGAILNPATGHWYDIVGSGITGAWSDAETNAVALGGHLVTINDAAEETWLRASFGSNTQYWIGFSDAAVEGTWAWASGEAVTYTNWAAGEPSNTMPPPIGENYAVLNFDASTGAWNDWDYQRPDYSYTFGIGEFAVKPPERSTFSLSGTVRDFNDTHPDMERGGPIGLDPGIVATTLGADGKPVYAGGSIGSTTDAANFSQWYNDVPGVNQSKNFTIQLDDIGEGLYQFSDSSFFPIDDQLLGNQGRDHNYHFTFEAHSGFVYQGGETLTLKTDDDAWVFIDDQLVVDLGGLHPATSASLNVDALGLTVGHLYDFDLFFAERQTTQSELTLQTSIEFIPEPASLLIWCLIGLTYAGAAWRWRRRRAM
jgi:fibro-slime domain-containing protein